MTQYLTEFLPNLDGDLQSIRKLTRKKKDDEWNWSEKREESLQEVKKNMHREH